MNCSARTLIVLVVGFGFAGSALAAMDSAGSTSGQNAAPKTQGATPNAPMHLSQRLHDDLAKAGFTDIKIMPSSFLVRAKDSQGNPVMMVINPDSMAEVTEHTAPHKDAPLSGAIKGAPNSPIPSPAPKQ